MKKNTTWEDSYYEDDDEDLEPLPNYDAQLEKDNPPVTHTIIKTAALFGSGVNYLFGTAGFSTGIAFFIIPNNLEVKKLLPIFSIISWVGNIASNASSFIYNAVDKTKPYYKKAIEFVTNMSVFAAETASGVMSIIALKDPQNPATQKLLQSIAGINIILPFLHVFSFAVEKILAHKMEKWEEEKNNSRYGSYIQAGLEEENISYVHNLRGTEYSKSTNKGLQPKL